MGDEVFSAMNLTTKGRYAMMAMADLATHGSVGPVSIADLSVRQAIAPSYLEQLFSKLRRAGLVKAARGRTGGYRLARDAQAICVLDVIEAAEESIRTTRCDPESREGCLAHGARCMTHDLWAALGDHIRAFFGGVTLADVVEGRVAQMGFDLDARLMGAAHAKEAAQ